MKSFARFAIALFVVLVGASISSADAGTPITKEYDLNDLLVVVPNFDNAPQLNQPVEPTTREALAPAAQQDDRDNVEMTNAMSAWVRSLARADEPAIRIERAGEKFAITATSDQHQRLDRHIADLLVERHTQITVETRFIHLGAKGEAQLPAAAAEKADFVRAPGRGSAGLQIDDATASAFIDAARNDPEASTLTAPRVTIFNGQRAYVLVATQRTFTTGHRKLDDGTWEPKTEAYQLGLLLDVRCRADQEGKTVAINLKPELTRLMSVREEAFEHAPADLNLRVEIPKLDARKLDALATGPSGGTMLFYIPPGPDVPADTPHVYVLVRPTVALR